MRRLLSIIATLSLVFLLSSCDVEKVKYAVQVDDAAQVLSAKEVKQLESVDITAGYQVVVVTVDSILEQNIYKHTRKEYRQIIKQSNNADVIAIFCFKNEGLITTKLPVSLQNIIDSQFINQYFESQRIDKGSSYGKQALKVLEIVSSAIIEHEELSGFKKGSITNGICGLFDLVFRYTIPQDSWVYKVVFHIPMLIALSLVHIVGSVSMWVILIFIALLLVYRHFIYRLVVTNGSKPKYLLFTLIYFALKILIILTICCLYTTSLPRQELLWSMQQYGISETLTQSLLDNFHNATTPHFGWLGCTIFCIFMVIASIVSHREVILYAFYKPEIQHKLYKQNRDNILAEMNIERAADTIEQGYDDSSFDISKLDNAEKPYMELFSHYIGKSLSTLFYIVPMCLVLNANLILIFVLYKCISFSENTLVLVEDFIVSHKRGLLD